MPPSTAFYPGPDEIRLHYTVGTQNHEARYNCQVVSYPSMPFIFSDVDLLQANAGSQQLDTWLDAWVALLRPIYNSSVATFNFAELWHYETDSYVSSYRSTYDISLAGTSGTTSNVLAQSIYMFRTTGGHRMMIQAMGCIRSAGGALGYAGMTASEQAIVDAILDPTNCWAARDNTFPVAFVHLLPGNNEASFKKQYRNY